MADPVCRTFNAEYICGKYKYHNKFNLGDVQNCREHLYVPV
jgi:hypothetical protein